MIRSIPDIRVTDQATRDALEAMKEIIEVMLGRRGSDPDDHVLTRGDSSTIVALFEALNTGLSHDTLADVSADDHHSEAHTVASHSDTTATGAELEELTDGSDTTLHDHDGISENSAARHAQAHTVASHSDTTATGAELETLTDNSIADTLHRHSELVASDGSPDPALSVDAGGYVGIGIDAPAKILHIKGASQARGEFTSSDTNTQRSGFRLAHSTTENMVDGFGVHINFEIGDDTQALNAIARIEARRSGADNKGGLAFFAGAAGGEEFLSIDADGKVGVGTTSPDTKLQVVGDTKFGDDNTNYVETSATGDMVFVGSGGLCFGEIYGADTGTTITISGTTKTNKVQISAFAVNGVSNNTTPDHTNNHITITKAGMYMCNVSMHVNSISGGTAEVYGYSVYKNDGGTEFLNLHGQRNMAGSGGDEGSISLSGIIDLAVDDTIEVWIWNNTNNDDVIVDDINLSLLQIGGT